MPCLLLTKIIKQRNRQTGRRTDVGIESCVHILMKKKKVHRSDQSRLSHTGRSLISNTDVTLTKMGEKEIKQ